MKGFILSLWMGAIFHPITASAQTDEGLADLQARVGVETFAATCLATFPSFDGIGALFEREALEKKSSAFWSAKGDFVSASLSDDKSQCFLSIAKTSGKNVIPFLIAALDKIDPDWQIGESSGLPAARVRGQSGYFIVRIIPPGAEKRTGLLVSPMASQSP